MSLWVDAQYVNRLQPFVRNFKRKADYNWNFSCPFCGDSKKNERKARGNIYRSKTGLNFKCHNCGKFAYLNDVFKIVNEALYKEYISACFNEQREPEVKVNEALYKTETVQLTVDSILDPLRRIDQMDPNHPAVKYVKKRKIPEQYWHLFYFVAKFKKYVNTLIPDKFKSLEKDNPRLIIPFFNNHGKCFGFQGRAFGTEEPKYITIKLDDTEEKIFGMERIDYSKPIFAVEGPIDSLFLPNCIAVTGSTFGSPTIKALQSNLTIIYDNEPRSPVLCKLIEKTIDQGYTICLWPEEYKDKDINDMIKNGKTKDEILLDIKRNTYKGIEAKLRFSTWKKC